MADEQLDAINQAIADAATTPASASTQGRSATARSVEELQKAAAHTAGKEAVKRRGAGLRFRKVQTGDALL